MHITREYRRLLTAEEMLDADIKNAKTVPKDRAACARVLVAVLDMKRVIRMKPKPKDIDVSKLQPRRRAAANVDAMPLTLAPEPENPAQSDSDTPNPTGLERNSA